MKKMCILLSVIAILITSSVSAMPLSYLNKDETVTRQGNYIYTPLAYRVSYAEKHISDCGIIPDSEDGIIASAPEMLARMVEIAAMYRYTGDREYLELFKKAASARENLIAGSGGYVPYYFTTSCEPASFATDQGILSDAITLGQLLIAGEAGLPEVTVEKSMSYSSCSWESSTLQGEESLPSICQVLGLEENATAGEDTEEIEEVQSTGCTEECYTAQVRVEYTIKDMKNLEIDVKRVWVQTQDGEVEVDPSSLNLDALKAQLSETALDDYLNAIAREVLKNPEVKKGVYEKKGNGLLYQAAKQTFSVLRGEEPDTFKIARYGREWQGNILTDDCQDVCLYRGAVYIPFLVDATNLTRFSGIIVSEDLSYTVNITQGWNLSRGRLYYTEQGWNPLYGGIQIIYHPIRSYIVHYAGSLESMTYYLTGSERLTEHISHYARMVKIPTGVYSVSSAFIANDSSTVVARVPGISEAYREPANPLSSERLLLVANLSWREADKLRKEAYEDSNAAKLFIALENLYANSIGKSPDSSIAREISVLLSLSNSTAWEFAQRKAESPGEAVRYYQTYMDFRRVFHDTYLPVVREAVRQDIARGKPSQENRVLLAVLADKARRADLEDFQEIYAAYTEYFSEHTKNYTTLKALAEAAKIEEILQPSMAIERGDLSQNLTAELSGDVRKILTEEIQRRAGENEQLKANLTAKLGGFTSGVVSLEESLEEVKRAEKVFRDSKLALARQILESAQQGRISEQQARDSIAGLFGFTKPAVVAPPPPQEEKKPPAPEDAIKKPVTQQEQPQPSQTQQQPGKRSSQQMVAIVVLLVAGIIAIVLKLRRRQPPVIR